MYLKIEHLTAITVVLEQRRAGCMVLLGVLSVQQDYLRKGLIHTALLNKA